MLGKRRCGFTQREGSSMAKAVLVRWFVLGAVLGACGAALLRSKRFGTKMARRCRMMKRRRARPNAKRSRNAKRSQNTQQRQRAPSASSPSPSAFSWRRGRLDGLPDSLRLVDVEDAERIRDQVEEWINEAGFVRVNRRRGIAYAKSEDDSGADPPYPQRVGPQGIHACGLQAEWLVESIRQTFRAHGGEYANAPIRCQGAVCCFAAMGEYDSAGGAVFGLEGTLKMLAAWHVADNGTLGGEYVASNYAEVRRRMTPLTRRRCRGEPASD